MPKGSESGCVWYTPELYNDYLEIYYDQYMALSDARKEVWVINMILRRIWRIEESEEFEESPNIPPMPSLKGDEEKVKEGKGLKILTPNKLLTRLPILLTQIKAGNNSYKLKSTVSFVSA